MCKYNQLYIWVEGKRDKKFFERVVKSGFERIYGRGRVHIRQYRPKKDKEVVGLIKNFKAVGNDCIGVTDINSAPCVTKRKEEKQEKEFVNVDKDSIMIVVKEIESWYLAGLDKSACQKLGVAEFENTEMITKHKFDSLLRRSKISNFRIDSEQEILKHFDIETAKQKNESFRYFAEKFVRKYGLQSIGNVDNNT